jgi:cold-inducible RNA-binding protein
MNKLYVGNLPYKATEEELWDHFKDAGHPPSEVKIITDRDTGRSKGFGFVTLEGGDAKRAIEDLNGQEFHGRALTVNEARPMEKREGRYSRQSPRW